MRRWRVDTENTDKGNQVSQAFHTGHCGELRKLKIKKSPNMHFPGGAVVKNLPANAGDTGSSPGPGGSRIPRSN